MEILLNARQHPWSKTERERKREREREGQGNGSGKRDTYRAREWRDREGEIGEAERVAKVDYILLSQPATCCTLGRTGLPGKSNHR